MTEVPYLFFLSLFGKDFQVLALTTILPGVSKDYAFLKFSVTVTDICAVCFELPTWNLSVEWLLVAGR